MSIKDLLTVFRHDHLSHYQWASWFAAAAAILTLVVAVTLAALPLALACLLGAIASVATAVAAGKAGELLDARTNAAAIANGEWPPREVSEGDVRASALGCLPSALPLLAAYLVAQPCT